MNVWREFSLIFKNKKDFEEFMNHTLVPEAINLQQEIAKTILNFHFFTYRLPAGAIRVRIRMEAPEEKRLQEFEAWLKKKIRSLGKIEGFGQVLGIKLELNDYPTAEEIERFGGGPQWEEHMWYLTLGTFLFAKFSSAASFPSPDELYVMLHPIFNNSLLGYPDELSAYRICCDMAENGIWDRRLSQFGEAIVSVILNAKSGRPTTQSIPLELWKNKNPCKIVRDRSYLNGNFAGDLPGANPPGKCHFDHSKTCDSTCPSWEGPR